MPKNTTSSRRERPLYAQAWLARYGQALTREEVRLVQGYRGLPRRQRDALRALIADVVLHNTERTGGRS